MLLVMCATIWDKSPLFCDFSLKDDFRKNFSLDVFNVLEIKKEKKKKEKLSSRNVSIPISVSKYFKLKKKKRKCPNLWKIVLITA